MLSKISSMLDVIADSLEAKGLIKEAYEIDKIADIVDASNSDIAFIPHTSMTRGFAFVPPEALSALKTKSNSDRVEYHNPNSEGKNHTDTGMACNCPDKGAVGHLSHVVLRNPKNVSMAYVEHEWANPFSKGPNVWIVGEYPV